jgi:hypothetical protein
MSFMDAPPYNAKKEDRIKYLLIGSLVAVILIIGTALTGYFMGHGWFFSNVPAEMRVNTFMNTVEKGNFEKAYAIWMHDDQWQQHPQQYEYSFQRFKEDWSTESDYGIIHSHHVNFSRRDKSSIIIGVTINGSPDMLFLLYETKHGTLSYSPVKLAY